MRGRSLKWSSPMAPLHVYTSRSDCKATFKKGQQGLLGINELFFLPRFGLKFSVMLWMLTDDTLHV